MSNKIRNFRLHNRRGFVLTILTDVASLFITLIAFEVFPLLAGEGFFPSISFLRFWPLDPKTFLSSQISTWYKKNKQINKNHPNRLINDRGKEQYLQGLEIILAPDAKRTS